MSFRYSILASAFVLALSGCAKKSTEEHIASAKQFVDSGQNEAAILELKNAIAGAPDNAELRELLGDIYLSIGESDSAEKELQRALQLAPGKLVEYTPKLMEARLSNNDFEGLSTLFRDSELGDCQDCRLTQAWLSLINGENIEIDSVIGSYPQSEQWKALSLQQFASGELAQTRDTLESNKSALLTSTPSERLILGQVALRSGASEIALSVFNGLLEEKPKMSWLHIPLAQVQFALKNHAEAEKHVNDVLRVNRKHGLGNYMLGLILSARGQYEEANTAAEAAMTSGYDTTGSRLLLGVTQYKLQRYEQSLSNLRVAIQDLPEDHFAHQLLISNQLKLGYTDEAVQQLVQKDNLSALDMPLIGMSVSMLGNSDSEQALKEMLQQRVEGDEYSESGFSAQKNLIKLALGEQSGIDELEQVLADEQGKETLSMAKVVFHLREGNTQQALDVLQEWKQSSPDNVDPLNLEAALFYARGEFEQANEAYKKANAISPNNAPSMFFDIRYTLANEGFDAAIGKAKALLDAHPLHLSGLRVLVVLSRNSGRDLGDAIDYATKATKTEGNNVQHHLMLASTYASSGAAPLAEKVLSEMDQAEAQKRNQFWELKHLIATGARNDQSVEENFEDWKRSLPEQPRSYLAYADYLMSTKQNSEAANIMRQASEAFPNNDIVRTYEAYLLIESGNDSRAKRVIEELEAKPRLKAIGAFVAGYYYAKKDQNDMALRKFRQHYELTSANRSALLIAQIMKKQNQDFSGFLEKHVVEQPGDLRSRNMLAESYIGKRPEQAMSHYKEYIANGGQEPVALNNYAWLLGQSKDYSKAKELSQKAIELSSEEVGFWDTYAEILLNNQEYQEVESFLGDKFTRLPSLSAYYAEALIRLNKKEKAKEVLTTTSLSIPDNLKSKWQALLAEVS